MRPSAEWLLVPLFALPLLGGVGLAAWARSDHERTLSTFRSDGARLATVWLDPDGGPAAWMRDAVLRDHSPAADEPGAQDDVPFVHPAGHGHVRLPDAERLGTTPWVVADVWPVGLSAGALADRAVRLEVEQGTPPAALAHIDVPTAEIKTLLERPNLERLRAAPLRAATKAFLLDAWEAAGVVGVPFSATRDLLAVLARLDAALEGRGGALTVGAHDLDGLHVLFAGASRPMLVLPPGRDVIDTSYVEDGDADALVSLSWAATSAPVPGALWQGRLEQPLAGTFAFVPKHGAGWWRAPRYRRWIGPVAALLVALLLLPVALGWSMRKRRRLDRARSRFVNELAHDLRTPLTSLRLHAEMLDADRAPAEKRARYAHLMAQEATRLSALLGNLLDLSRLDGAGRAVALEDVCVSDAVDDAVRDFVGSHPRRADDLTVTGPDDAIVVADRVSLARCIGNLLDNAGKFSDPGTPLRVAWQRYAGRIRVEVIDEGPGIPATERARVFARYERGAAAREGSVRGTGLGLSIVAELMSAMRGTVRLGRSRVGARFVLTLPAGAERDDA